MATKKSSPAKSSPAKSSPAKSAPAKSTASKAAVTKVASKKTALAKAPADSPAKTSATHQQIAELAHKYFTERGHSHGSHVADWLRAEKELNS